MRGLACVFLLALSVVGFAQVGPAAVLPLSNSPSLLSPLTEWQLSVFPYVSSDQQSTPIVSYQRKWPLPYSFAELAFFCKWEVRIEQASGLPFRFRLGSVDYVDYLEGKREQY